mgnify:CR=1 FL=1
MNKKALADKIESYLKTLCVDIGNRPPGSKQNRQATDYFIKVVRFFGYQPQVSEFDCIDWEYGDVLLTTQGNSFSALAGPYSLPCDLRAELVEISTLEELENSDISSKLVLLHGDITKEQLMPKGFTFYNPDEHKHIISLLEEKKPAAIIAATSKNPEMVGSQYPFPLFEDGDFDIPSVYMKDTEGAKMLQYTGKEAYLRFESCRIPSNGCNVIARKKGIGAKRIVVCAQIDSRKGTPGALDNASGTVVLLALAELLKDYSGKYQIEIFAINGEDYYANSGEMLYLDENHGKMDDILLAINLDDVGAKGERTAFSFYECSEDIKTVVRKANGSDNKIIEGDPWHQGDHMIFVINQRPAVALTSENMMKHLSEITHTERDTFELVDCDMLAETAFFLREVILCLNGN